jgi:hypothetical protein
VIDGWGAIFGLMLHLQDALQGICVEPIENNGSLTAKISTPNQSRSCTARFDGRNVYFQGDTAEDPLWTRADICDFNEQVAIIGRWLSRPPNSGARDA